MRSSSEALKSSNANGACCGALVRFWHFSSNRCNAQFRELSEVQRTCHEPVRRVDPTLMPSRPGEFHPEPLTEPDLILSHHTARATARRLPPSIEHRVPPVAG